MVYMSLLTRLWLLTHHVFSSTQTNRGAITNGDRGITARPIGNERFCLPECPTIDGFRGPGHHQRDYSCAKRRKNLYSPSYFHILDQMMSLSGTAAWQVVRPPLSANGHVVSRDAYKPGANPIQAKLTYARWRANAASKHCTHSIGALPACSALLLHPPRRLGFRVFEQAAELPQVMEIQGPVPPTSPFPS